MPLEGMTVRTIEQPPIPAAHGEVFCSSNIIPDHINQENTVECTGQQCRPGRLIRYFFHLLNRYNKMVSVVYLTD